MFDAQVVQTNKNSEMGKLMSQYVTARITQMNGIDIGLYDYDRHNAVYYFIVNAEEQIYLRYGGRDEESPESYLNLQSLQKALAQGLEQHEKYKLGKLPAPPRPKSYQPKDIMVLNEEVTERKRCVECHLIADYQTQQRFEAGNLDPIRDLFVSPDIKNLGIQLDVPQGLVIKKATGAVHDAGMRDGDTITAIDGTPVLTFGDLQYFYDKTDRQATSISLQVERSGEHHTLNVDLPREWWWTDTYFRYWSLEPLVFFWSEPLSDTEKSDLGLPVEGFASLIVEVDPAAQVYMLHKLEEGDIIYDIDGNQIDPDTRYVERHIQLRKRVGDNMNIGYIRDGERAEMKMTSHQQSYRKALR
ncbi:MAG: Trx7/PDZ domain-containing (seleno)protein [Candidatus Hydrogenedentota bacterium]